MNDKNGLTPIPLHILTGFLGSGKTSLLNSLANHADMKNAAIIVNEFGEIGLDHLLLGSFYDGVVELSSGCICCGLRGALVDALEDLLLARDEGRVKPFDRVIVETTGLADPVPILHMIMSHPVLSVCLHPGNVIALIDVVHGLSRLEAHEEALRQLAMADHLVLTKIDLVSDCTKILTLRQRLALLNPFAEQLEAVHGDITPSIFHGIRSRDSAARVDLCQRFDMDACRVAGTAAAGEARLHAVHPCDDNHEARRNESRIRSFAVTTDGAMTYTTLENFLDLLNKICGRNLLRVKGLVRLREDPDRPLVVQGVGQFFHPHVYLPTWPDHDRRTRLVIIARDVDETRIADMLDVFAGQPRVDMAGPDVHADNPLALYGF